MLTKKTKKTVILLIAISSYLVGGALIFYPTVSNLINRERNLKIISSYEESLQAESTEDLSCFLEEAETYNREHRRNYIRDAFACNESKLSEQYSQMLDPQGNGVMGYVEIPKIGETLAIYHGVGEEVLQKGAGHIEGTSLPVGGAGTHAVIAAHRGLPSAKLFTDIDRLEIGDIFRIHVLGLDMAYRVDRILTVDPEDTDALKIEEGEDLVTLLTCTPYGVNSKRLLVRGHRIPYEEDGPFSGDNKGRRPIYLEMLITSLTVAALIIAVMVRNNNGRRKYAWKTKKE